MIILSLYCGHNAAACILKNGKVLINWELERFSRIKHDYGYNQEFINKTLELCDLTIQDVDILSINFRDYGRKIPFHVPNTCNVTHIEFQGIVNGKTLRSIACNHHLSHAASAYYTSPFLSSTVLSLDGGGCCENKGTSIFEGNKLIEFKPGSAINIAGIWSGITMNNYRMPRLHAWDPGSGSGKIMALAAYAPPNEQIEQQLIRDMKKGGQPHYTDVHGPAFNNNEDLTDTHSLRSQTVASSIQSLTEKFVHSHFEQAYKTFPNDNICYAGGIALNCVANTRILKQSNFKNLHVPPFPNDTGLAIGMALYVWHHILNNPKSTNFFSPYNGPEYNENDSLMALKAHKDLSYKKLNMNELAELISNENIVCVFKGKSESGPRALGHRSIIALPTIENLQDYLNSKTKLREWYRPYAPIVLENYADEVLENYIPHSPYMTTSATIKKEWRDRLLGVCHIDKTTRPQIVTKDHCGFVYKLLKKVYSLTNIPVLLNTSFNRKEPIVETPKEALETFKKLPIKYLVLDNFLVSK
tara:strand:- start:868 stop:2454 length:1587 start_codon:yes stop_codon:yes gene_type:complete